jgi:hypothetical protein
MQAFLGISVWIALATVLPGLVTIAVLYGAFALANPALLEAGVPAIEGLNEWVFGGLAITIMILTQALGILLEGLFIRNQWLGPAQRDIRIPEGIDPLGLTHFSLEPYAEYQGLYLLLAELREHEDAQGHLQRALAQFFLTNNTLISYASGIVATLLIGWYTAGSDTLMAQIYLAVLAVCLLVSFKVARIRFEVMAKALWAARRRRIEPEEETGQKVPVYIEI